MIVQQLDGVEGKPDRLLLYIDQWEELYAWAPSNSDKKGTAQHATDVIRFIDLVLSAARTAPVTVIATVRADFYDPLIAHQQLASLLPVQQLTLTGLSRAKLQRTITEPARMVGLSFDPPRLVEGILDEAGEDEGMLPLLQYALKESWALRNGNTITADCYARSGGVREAIRNTAERTFEALSVQDQQAARQLFLRLVTPGEGQEDTRARLAMPLRAKLTDAQAQQVIARLLQQISKTTDPYPLRALIEGLTTLPPKLTDAQARQAIEPLLQQIGKTTDSGTLRDLAKGLTALAAKLTEPGLGKIRPSPTSPTCHSITSSARASNPTRGEDGTWTCHLTRRGAPAIASGRHSPGC